MQLGTWRTDGGCGRLNAASVAHTCPKSSRMVAEGATRGCNQDIYTVSPKAALWSLCLKGSASCTCTVGWEGTVSGLSTCLMEPSHAYQTDHGLNTCSSRALPSTVVCRVRFRVTVTGFSVLNYSILKMGYLVTATRVKVHASTNVLNHQPSTQHYFLLPQRAAQRALC